VAALHIHDMLGTVQVVVGGLGTRYPLAMPRGQRWESLENKPCAAELPGLPSRYRPHSLVFPENRTFPIVPPDSSRRCSPALLILDSRPSPAGLLGSPVWVTLGSRPFPVGLLDSLSGRCSHVLLIPGDMPFPVEPPGSLSRHCSHVLLMPEIRYTVLMMLFEALLFGTTATAQPHVRKSAAHPRPQATTAIHRESGGTHRALSPWDSRLRDAVFPWRQANCQCTHDLGCVQEECAVSRPGWARFWA
jgi:hypothetical protein